MQDSEFDQLFKDKLREAEIEPSADLWNKIAIQLEPKKRKVLPNYWMAAAVLLVALLVALLMPEKEKIQLRGADTVYNASAVKAEAVVSTVVKETLPSAEDDNKSTPLVIAPRLTDAEVKKDFAAVQPKASNDHLVGIEPESTMPVIAKLDPEPIRIDTDLVIANADVVVSDNEISETQPIERRGIKNVGDLVNYVVEKVDKRDRKFIKFNTDEDDNSSLVAINIGILKFNKRSDK